MACYLNRALIWDHNVRIIRESVQVKWDSHFVKSISLSMHLCKVRDVSINWQLQEPIQALYKIPAAYSILKQ